MSAKESRPLLVNDCMCILPITEAGVSYKPWPRILLHVEDPSNNEALQQCDAITTQGLCGPSFPSFRAWSTCLSGSEEIAHEPACCHAHRCAIRACSMCNNVRDYRLYHSILMQAWTQQREWKQCLMASPMTRVALCCECFELT